MFIFLYSENILNSDHKVKVLYNDLPLKYDFYIELHNSMLQTAPPLATTANMIISYYAVLNSCPPGGWACGNTRTYFKAFWWLLLQKRAESGSLALLFRVKKTHNSRGALSADNKL